MNAISLDRIASRPATQAARQAAAPAAVFAAGFRPYLWLLTAFWVYVAVSNVMYAYGMQLSLSQKNVQHVYASADARLLQHLLLYPLFVLCVWRSLRMGWTPWARRLPLQLGLALLVVLSASPLMMVSEKLLEPLHPDMYYQAQMHSAAWQGWRMYFAGSELAVWLASATNFLVTYGFGLALVNGLSFHQRMRDAQSRSAALERALTQAHLATLRAQLSPHTLFNLLHTIRGQIVWDPPAAQAMVVQLGDLLRRLLNAGSREFSTVTDEVQFVGLYLKLQKERFADRLTVVVPGPAELPRAWVPSLIVQPLVENAVVHGLAGHEGPVLIQVEVVTQGERVALCVRNTIARGRAAGAHGVGLSNVRQRLEVQFGAQAQFTAQAVREDLWESCIHLPLLRDGPGGELAAAEQGR
ncbi:MAG: histidine kinase [Proteobacteria bacterium]|nr:histidine kinase [Pseudomonadota bacterium]